LFPLLIKLNFGSYPLCSFLIDGNTIGFGTFTLFVDEWALPEPLPPPPDAFFPNPPPPPAPNSKPPPNIPFSSFFFPPVPLPLPPPLEEDMNPPF
jgi:hypothetical protein